MPSPPPFPERGTIAARITTLGVQINVHVYRLTGGRLLGRLGKSPFLLLDHVGAKSGQRRTTPLVYTRDGDNILIVASSGGSRQTPGWFFNLRANPQTRVQVGSKRLDVNARVAEGAERKRLWPKVVANYGDFATYQERTDREIPVIVLEPIG